MGTARFSSGGVWWPHPPPPQWQLPRVRNPWDFRKSSYRRNSWQFGIWEDPYRKEKRRHEMFRLAVVGWTFFCPGFLLLNVVVVGWRGAVKLAWRGVRDRYHGTASQLEAALNVLKDLPPSSNSRRDTFMRLKVRSPSSCFCTFWCFYRGKLQPDRMKISFFSGKTVGTRESLQFSHHSPRAFPWLPEAHDIGCAGKLRLSRGFRRHVCQVTFKKGAMWILAAGGVSLGSMVAKIESIGIVD